MKIISIKASNFQSYEKMNLDISKLQGGRNNFSCGIIGEYEGKQNSDRSNGSGKTTIFDVVLYNLYGKGRSSSESGLINEEKDEMLTEVEYLINDQNIKITRKAFRKKTGKLVLLVDGKDQSENKKETQKRIERVIGLSYDLFIATVFFMQTKQDQFTSALPSERKNYLKDLLGLEFYDKCLDSAKKEFKEKDQEKNKILAKIEHLESQIEGIEEGALLKEIVVLEKEAVISKEFSSISDKKRRFNELRVDIGFLESVHQENMNSLKTKKNELSSLPDLKEIDLSELKSKSDKLRSLIGEKQQISAVLDSKIEAHIKIGVSLKDSCQCPTCAQGTDNDFKKAYFPVLKKSIRDWREEQKEATKFIKEKKSDLFDIDQQYKSGVKENESYSRNEANKVKLKSALKSLSEKINSLEGQIKSSKEDFEILKSFISKAGDSKNSRDYQVVLQEIAEKKASLESLKESEDSIKSKKKKLSKIQKEILILDNKKSVFGKNGATADIIGSCLDEIEDEANSLLQDIDPDGKSIRFDTKRELKTGEIADTLDIWIKTSKSDSERLWETFSVGQKSIINFCVRFSLASYLLRKKSIWLGMVVLDEVFTSLDKFNRNGIVKVVNYLKKEFNQIFVISHTELKDKFESLIEVQFDANTEKSRIKRAS
jgi:DNA repair exonuclease SbcCD ATPase subunit